MAPSPRFVFQAALTVAGVLIALAQAASLASAAAPHFTEPQPFGDGFGFGSPRAEDPQIATGPDGATTVVWSGDGESGDAIEAARIGTDGIPREPQTLFSASDLAGPGEPYGVYEPRSIIDPSGTVTVAFRISYRDDPRKALGVTQIAPGGTVGEPQIIAPDIQGPAALALDGDQVVIAWATSSWVSATIETTRISPGGQATPAVTIADPAPAERRYSVIGMEAAGEDGLTLAWTEPDVLDPSLQGRLRAGRLEADGLSEQRTVLGASKPFSDPTLADSRAFVFRQDELQSVPLAGGRTRSVARAPDGVRLRVASDRLGFTTAVWWSRHEVRSVRFGRRGGLQEVRNLTPGDLGGRSPEIAVDSRGRGYVAWRTPGRSIAGVELSRIGNPGRVTKLPREQSSYTSPEVAFDSNDHAVVVWRENARVPDQRLWVVRER